jgi:EamA-like transporter family.
MVPQRIEMEKGLNKFSGYLFLACAFTLAGTSVISARLVSGGLGTFTITAVSLFLALPVLLPLRLKKLTAVIRRMRFQNWAHVLLQALFGIFLFRLLLLQGILRTGTAEAGVLTGATPAITALLARLWLKEPVQLKNAVGIVSTVAGIALIQGPLTHSFAAQHIFGNILVLGAAACEAIFNLLSRRSATGAGLREAFDPVAQTALVTAAAFMLSLPLALFEQPLKALSALNVTGWLALLWYGWFVTATAFICWYAGIRRCPAHIAAAFSGMMPFTSMLLSATLLGEAAGWRQWAGAALVMLGMTLIGLNATPRRSKPAGLPT